MQSSGFAPISRLFPLSLTPYPSPLLPAKSLTSFPFASVARRLFLLQNRSRGCECGYTQKDARPAVGGRGNDSSRGSQLSQPSLSETILSPWSLQKLRAAVGGRGHQPQSLLQGCSQRARSPGILTPPFGRPSSLPTRRARGSAALLAGQRRGGDEASGRSGGRWKAGAARQR